MSSCQINVSVFTLFLKGAYARLLLCSPMNLHRAAKKKVAVLGETKDGDRHSQENS